jgi:DNA-directed RNA polymerase specialized sigma24 family protein
MKTIKSTDALDLALMDWGADVTGKLHRIGWKNTNTIYQILLGGGNDKSGVRLTLDERMEYLNAKIALLPQDQQKALVARYGRGWEAEHAAKVIEGKHRGGLVRSAKRALLSLLAQD